jgi:hypothetical protein
MANEVEVFVVLVNGNFQTVRGEYDAAMEVADNFNSWTCGPKLTATVVRGRLFYDPKDYARQ